MEFASTFPMKDCGKHYHRFLVLSFWIVCCAGLLQAQPTNDLFVNRTTIPNTNITVVGSTVGATNEPGEPVHAENGGGVSAWWTWTAPFDGIAAVTTEGSSFDTVLGVYKGASVAGLTNIASNDDENYPYIATSKGIFFATAGQTYQIAVDGYLGDSGDVALRVLLGLPQPAPAWVYPGTNGVPVNSTNFAGKVVLMNFWASWCGPCKSQMPDMVTLQNKYRTDGLAVVGAAVSDVLSNTLNFLATNTFGINYQIILAEGLQKTFGDITTMPTSFVINRQNLTVKSYVGTQTFSTLEQGILPWLYDGMRLSFQKNSNQLVLTWPTNTVTFVLDSSFTLKNPTWTQWPTNPVVSNGSNSVTVPVAGTNRFFRLRFP